VCDCHQAPAAVVAEPGDAAIDTAVRTAVERALLDAASAWQWGQWTVLTPQVKAGSVIGAAQAVTDWLRERAAMEAGR
jgi:hypothetical protein